VEPAGPTLAGAPHVVDLPLGVSGARGEAAAAALAGHRRALPRELLVGRGRQDFPPRRPGRRLRGAAGLVLDAPVGKVAGRHAPVLRELGARAGEARLAQRAHQGVALERGEARLVVPVQSGEVPDRHLGHGPQVGLASPSRRRAEFPVAVSVAQVSKDLFRPSPLSLHFHCSFIALSLLFHCPFIALSLRRTTLTSPAYCYAIIMDSSSR
jgi:hypothetical protein